MDTIMRSAVLCGMLISGMALGAPPRTAELDVQNMNCAMCPLTVRKALERVPGVASARVDFQSKTATVVYDPDRAGPRDLTRATGDAGYPSTVHP